MTDPKIEVQPSQEDLDRAREVLESISWPPGSVDIDDLAREFVKVRVEEREACARIADLRFGGGKYSETTISREIRARGAS